MKPSLAGLVLYSPEPDRLSQFYRHAFGVALENADHGTVGAHQEGMLGAVHVAVWHERAGHGAGPLVPVYRVESVAEASAAMEALGARRLHRVIELGEGKRVVGYADPDGRPLRLIELR